MESPFTTTAQIISERPNAFDDLRIIARDQKRLSKAEKALIEGLAKRLYDEERPSEHSRYIHHFLDEENKHMTFFGNF